jgi:hypothetical protein
MNAAPPAQPLPDAPSMVALSDTAAWPVTTSSISSRNYAGIAPRYEQIIQAGYQSQPLSGSQKFLYSFREQATERSISSILVTAGWEQAWNSDPKYGTDRGAFGERLAASGVRHGANDIFSDGIFAPMFHQDPRFYVMGDGHSLMARVFNAASEVILTHRDSGGRTLNTSLFAGYAASAALTATYYPPGSRSRDDIVKGYGTSLLGVGLGFEVEEFLADAKRIAHLKHGD